MYLKMIMYLDYHVFIIYSQLSKSTETFQSKQWHTERVFLNSAEHNTRENTIIINSIERTSQHIYKTIKLVTGSIHTFSNR